MFGTDLGAVVVGSLGITDIITTLIVQQVGRAILKGLQVHYLHMFLFASFCGPAMGFVANLFFPPTVEDGQRQERIKQLVCKGRRRGETDAEKKNGIDGPAAEGESNGEMKQMGKTESVTELVQ